MYQAYQHLATHVKENGKSSILGYLVSCLEDEDMNTIAPNRVAEYRGSHLCPPEKGFS
jgi:hypothetical protein